MVEKLTISNNQQVSFEEVENNKNSIRWWRRPRNVIVCGILLVLLVIAGMLTIYSVWICKKEPPVCQTEACQTAVAQLLRNLNQSVDPCEDFFSFSCGKWVTAHPVPPDKEKITVYDTVWENNQEILKMLLEEPNKVRSSAEEKAVQFYRSCMNTTRIEELGSEPIVDLIEQVGGWSLSGYWNKTDFNSTLMVLMRDYQTFPFFRVHTGANPLDPHNSIIQIDQPEFWMSSSNKDKNYAETLRIKLQNLQTLAELSGKQKGFAEQYIGAVFAFASAIERCATSRQKGIEKKMLFQMLTIQDLQKMAPFFDWLAYLNALFYPMQLNESQPVYIHDLPYIEKMSTQTQKYPYALTKIYMILYLVYNLAHSLDSRYEKAKMKLMTQLSDTEMLPLPRWKKCVAETSAVFQPAVGAMFVRKMYSQESHQLAKEMITEIMSALKIRIDEVEWIDSQTRRDFKRKMVDIKVKLGYPEDIMNSDQIDQQYANYNINENEFFQNVVNHLKASRAQNFHLGMIDPSTESRWKVGPESVTAYYSMQYHEVVFPAGMFQLPFFHIDAPRALNFGGIGVIIAHEILHAFHDYVDIGKMCQECEAIPMQEKIACMVTQYNQYTLQGVEVNGNLTLQENMADCGGLEIAFKAYENWLWKNRGESVLPQSNLTMHQLFFTSYAQVMCGSQSNTTLSESLMKSRHSPSRYRVIGPLSNSKGFSHHFICPKESRMNPLQKCHIW